MEKANVMAIVIAAILGVATAIFVIGLQVQFHSPTTTRAQRDADCAQFLAALNQEERSRGLPIYTFYRCENGGTAHGGG